MMPATPGTTPVEIAVLWRHVNREMRALMLRAGKEYELPPFSFMLLRHIKEEPGVTLSELARRVGAAKSHISTTVEHLVKEGYVEKRSDPSDQRVVRLHVTEAARSFFASLGDRARGVWAVVLEEYDGPSEEVARFLQALLEAVGRACARFDGEAAGAEAAEAGEAAETARAARAVDASGAEEHTAGGKASGADESARAAEEGAVAAEVRER
ncbi:MAG: hypothetical protein CW345_09035 [Firmicutes bacterium]|mgnify:CR=1 FL=1|nr:hypothetical protein [Bacillota bacterium]MBO2521925.1 hypothetical protein [Bacillota bacterium]